jgi:hypothetical protein
MHLVFQLVEFAVQLGLPNDDSDASFDEYQILPDIENLDARSSAFSVSSKKMDSFSQVDAVGIAIDAASTAVSQMNQGLDLNGISAKRRLSVAQTTSSMIAAATSCKTPTTPRQELFLVPRSPEPSTPTFGSFPAFLQSTPSSPRSALLATFPLSDPDLVAATTAENGSSRASRSKTSRRRSKSNPVSKKFNALTVNKVENVPLSAQVDGSHCWLGHSPLSSSTSSDLPSPLVRLELPIEDQVSYSPRTAPAAEENSPRRTANC